MEKINVTLIGDSHSNTIVKSMESLYVSNRTNINIDRHFPIPGKHCYNADYSEINTMPESKILLHFGEVDIRLSLVKYKNTEEVVKRYVDKAVDYFKYCDLYFIKPIPQAEDSLSWEHKPGSKIGEGRRAYFLEEKLIEQNIFYSALDKYAPNVIDTPTAIGTNVLKMCDTDDGCHLNLEKGELLAEAIHFAINSQL
jgi:hypothetical protein